MLGQRRIRRGSAVVAACALAGALAAACGGSGPSTRDDEPAETAPPGEDDKLRAAQDEACAIMCTLLTRCSQVSLKAHWDELSEEDQRIAESLGPDDLARHTSECTGSCQASALSVRQVRAIRGCLNGMPAEEDPPPDQCEAYVRCLDGAQPSAP